MVTSLSLLFYSITFLSKIIRNRKKLSPLVWNDTYLYLLCIIPITIIIDLIINIFWDDYSISLISLLILALNYAVYLYSYCSNVIEYEDINSWVQELEMKNYFKYKRIYIFSVLLICFKLYKLTCRYRL